MVEREKREDGEREQREDRDSSEFPTRFCSKALQQ